MQLLLLIEITGERVELLGPELLVARHPDRGFLHRPRFQRAADHPPLLGAADQAGVLEHAQVLHEAGQRHPVRRGQLGHREVAAAQGLEDAAAGGIGQRREHRIELLVRILNHSV